MAHELSQPATYFCKSSVLGTQPCTFISVTPQLLSAMMAQWSSWNRDHMGCKSRMLTSCPFTWKAARHLGLCNRGVCKTHKGLSSTTWTLWLQLTRTEVLAWVLYMFHTNFPWGVPILNWCFYALGWWITQRSSDTVGISLAVPE